MLLCFGNLDRNIANCKWKVSGMNCLSMSSEVELTPSMPAAAVTSSGVSCCQHYLGHVAKIYIVYSVLQLLLQFTPELASVFKNKSKKLRSQNVCPHKVCLRFRWRIAIISNYNYCIKNSISSGWSNGIRVITYLIILKF